MRWQPTGRPGSSASPLPSGPEPPPPTRRYPADPLALARLVAAGRLPPLPRAATVRQRLRLMARMAAAARACADTAGAATRTCERYAGAAVLHTAAKAAEADALDRVLVRLERAQRRAGGQDTPAAAAALRCAVAEAAELGLVLRTEGDAAAGLRRAVAAALSETATLQSAASKARIALMRLEDPNTPEDTLACWSAVRLAASAAVAALVWSHARNCRPQGEGDVGAPGGSNDAAPRGVRPQSQPPPGVTPQHWMLAPTFYRLPVSARCVREYNGLEYRNSFVYEGTGPSSTRDPYGNAVAPWVSRVPETGPEAGRTRAVWPYLPRAPFPAASHARPPCALP